MIVIWIVRAAKIQRAAARRRTARAQGSYS